jgi:hypothetical protein
MIFNSHHIFVSASLSLQNDGLWEVKWKEEIMYSQILSHLEGGRRRFKRPGSPWWHAVWWSGSCNDIWQCPLQLLLAIVRRYICVCARVCKDSEKSDRLWNNSASYVSFEQNKYPGNINQFCDEAPGWTTGVLLSEENDVSLRHNVQTGFEARPTYEMGPGVLPQGKDGREVKLNTYLHLVKN